MAAGYQIRNWGQYQHYTDKRRMVWVKLYESLWRDQKFVRLPERLKLRLISLLTVCSLSAGRIVPHDLLYIRSVTALSFKSSDLEELVNAGFLIALDSDVASNSLECCEGESASDSLSSSSSTSISSSDLKKEDLTKKDLTVEPGNPVSDPKGGEADAEPGIKSAAAPAREQVSERRKAARPFPADFTLTEERAYYAWRNGLSDPRAVFEDFKNKAVAKDTRWVDWNAAWQNWVRQEVKFGNAKFPGPRDPKVTNFPTDDPVELARRRHEEEQRASNKQRDLSLAQILNVSQTSEKEGARA